MSNQSETSKLDELIAFSKNIHQEVSYNFLSLTRILEKISVEKHLASPEAEGPKTANSSLADLESTLVAISDIVRDQKIQLDNLKKLI